MRFIIWEFEQITNKKNAKKNGKNVQNSNREMSLIKI